MKNAFFGRPDKGRRGVGVYQERKKCFLKNQMRERKRLVGIFDRGKKCFFLGNQLRERE